VGISNHSPVSGARTTAECGAGARLAVAGWRFQHPRTFSRQPQANLLVHVRIVTAIRGDATPDGTTATSAESVSGTFAPEPFSGFTRRLETSDPVRFGAGVYHF
jgi:hypothetical protein